MSIQSHISLIIRYLVCIIMLAIPGAIFISCSDDLEFPTKDNSNTLIEKGYLTLNIEAGQHTTRATEAGVETLNENLIKSVTICLSPSSGDRTDDDPPAFMETFTDLDKQDQAVIRIPLTMELVTRLFNENSNKTCRVFAAVNVDPGDAKTVADLRKLAVGLTFNKYTRKQDCFTMDGDGIVTYNDVNFFATGTVPVKRSAAKITLSLNVDTTVTETVGQNVLTWEPNLDGMRVVLKQGVKDSNLDPKPEPNMPSDVYFNTPDDNEYIFNKITRPSGDKYAKYDREQDIPFYTYPNKWTDNIDEQHNTQLMLSVPWSSDGGTTWRTCYYNVPIVPYDQLELVRNNSYHIYLHVGVLGSFVPDEPLEITGDYFVADWGKEDINVEIKDFRYLVVDQNDFTINNEESIGIQFYTSHETVVTDVKMKFFRYNFSDQGSEFAVTVSNAQNQLSKTKGESVYECNFNNNNNILELSHELSIWVPYNSSNQEVSLIKGLDTGAQTNVRDANGRYFLDNATALNKVLNTIAYFKKKAGESEYSRIEYEVTVQHKDVYDGSSGIDRNLYKETVRITQFPGMYITAVQNFTGKLGSTWASGAEGNTFINGRTDNATYSAAGSGSGWSDQRWLANNYTNWDYSLGLSREYLNWNPNMYLVTITRLTNGSKYRIGDPRSYNINNYLANDGAYAGYTVDGGSDRVFKTEYWYYQVGNNAKGPETSSSFTTVFKGKYNPLDEKINVSTTYWNEYIINGFKNAPALNESKNRTLMYYYPTRENEDNKYTIAPKFRICSSYGGSSTYMTREMGRRRAAAYQEMGYCAGRWRLPTFGEVEYVIQLAADQKIPRLFGRNTGGTWFYWCAQGAVRVQDATVKNPTIEVVKNPTGGGSIATRPFTGDNYRDHVRFVYDEWYWGDGTLTYKPGSAPNYTFTWGDKIKTNPQD